MSKLKMSVHRALAELKLYNNKIQRAVSAPFIGSVKNSVDTINGVKVVDIKKEFQANAQVITNLFENSKRIKSAIVSSNATTVVSIGGKAYTVAEVIERKAKIVYEQRLLNEMKNQYQAHKSNVERQNDYANNGLESYLSTVLVENKKTDEAVREATKTYHEMNDWGLLDPNNLSKMITELEDEIETFKTEVDFVLAESNAKTEIEVELAD